MYVKVGKVITFLWRIQPEFQLGCQSVLVLSSGAQAVLGCDCSSLGHLLSLADSPVGAAQSDFSAVAGPQFIRLIRGNAASKAAGEQFGCSREMKGEVFIVADLFSCAAPGNFLRHSDAHAARSVGLGGHCDSLCHGEMET